MFRGGIEQPGSRSYDGVDDEAVNRSAEHDLGHVWDRAQVSDEERLRGVYPPEMHSEPTRDITSRETYGSCRLNLQGRSHISIRGR